MVLVRFSSTEIRDLIKAWLAVTLAFTILYAGLRFDAGVLIVFAALAISVGLGFLLHELAHKFVAQKYHAWAEFRSDDRMLLLMLAVSAFGFVFAAPGAVMIGGHLPIDKHGKVALAGPSMNILLAIVFAALTFIPNPAFLFAGYGATINAWLAVFNLLPFGPMDGAKVLMWSKTAWAAAGIASLGVLFLTFAL
ncbi:site-2 protease family protein [Candidatus Woesearchaeota archaeon]|nr:site-2 protease family protein [Candidatus Woesearchaeota archaeon]